MPRMPKTPAAVPPLLLSLLVAMLSSGCQRLPKRLFGELAPRADSLVASTPWKQLRCSDWVDSPDWISVKGCYAVGRDSVHRYFYVAWNGQVVSVGSTFAVPRDSVYSAVEHHTHQIAHRYGAPGECTERSVRTLFWHAPTQHTAVVYAPDSDRPRPTVDVVTAEGAVSCAPAVIYHSPAAIRS